MILDPEGAILNANLSSKIGLKDLNLVSRYEFSDAQTDDRINKNLESINLSALYTRFENFSFGADRRYDLSESAVASSTSSFEINFTSGFWDYQVSQTFDRREPEKTMISAIYEEIVLNLIFLCRTFPKQEALRAIFSLW